MLIQSDLCYSKIYLLFEYEFKIYLAVEWKALDFNYFIVILNSEKFEIYLILCSYAFFITPLTSHLFDPFLLKAYLNLFDNDVS